MLNFGESIISLLIVDLPNNNSTMYSTFYCGILTIAFLHVLHFRSQPLHADHHAMRRSKNAGVLFNLCMHMYTLALVSLGAAYTAFLVPLKEEDKGTRRLNHNLGLLSNILLNDGESTAFEQRSLAGSGGDGGTGFYDADTYNEKVAQLFCLSLALVYLALDLTTLCHLGFKEMQGRCYCKENGTNRKGFVLVVMRVLLMFFTATMYFWEQRPYILSIIGLLSVIVQIWLRKMGAIFLRSRKRNENLDRRRYYKQKLRCISQTIMNSSGISRSNNTDPLHDHDATLCRLR
jgi:hypothetical protein